MNIDLPPPQPPNCNNEISSSSPDIPQSSSQWKLFDMLKISTGLMSSKPKPDTFDEDLLISEEEMDVAMINCVCCGCILSYPPDALKFKCSICHTTNILENYGSYFRQGRDLIPHYLSYKYVQKVIDKCMVEVNSGGGGGGGGSSSNDAQRSLHEIFEPLSNYLYNAFKSYNCLNYSFKIKKSSSKIHYSTSNINYDDIRACFTILTKLPTKRPLYNALLGSLTLLKRIPISLGDDARNYCWLLILFEIPFLSHALTHYENSGSNGTCNTMVDVPEIKALCYDILKRVLGILANIESIPVKNYITSWFSRYPSKDFVSKVDLINVYITFQLKKYYYIANNPDCKSRLNKPSNNPSKTNSSPTNRNIDQEYFENSNFKEELEQMNLGSPPPLPLNQMNLSRSKSKSRKSSSNKIKLYQYGNDWHIKTASMTLLILYNANGIRADKLQQSIFYNSLVDYVHIKMDFDSWLSNKKFAQQKNSDQPEILTVIDYINGSRNSYSDAASFFFCKYPYLITLGNKISILEYEAKRNMERKAEEAFINSLDKKIPIDIYLRIRVRRTHVVQDSLKAIKANQNNLKKSLKVQFIDEPGVDAGGLKKEWFLLLTRKIFSPETGILVNMEESNYLWFCLVPMEDLEIYFLFGAILGLSIYNSTILDLNFPLVFYKILLNRPIGFSDFQQINPELSKNIFQIKQLNELDLKALDLTFEIDVRDAFGRIHTRELIPNGGKIGVNMTNRDFFIKKYAEFYLKDGINDQIKVFLKGFSAVIGGNGLSLFSPEEIELLLCGNEEGKLDIEVLKSVTKYFGWSSNDEAKMSNIVQWFWDYLYQLNYRQQKRFLVFVTGSDRVPATGIQNLSFTIKKINSHATHRLPISHTCFNQIDLYDYTTKEEFWYKLDLAVNESDGFGIK